MRRATAQASSALVAVPLGGEGMANSSKQFAEQLAVFGKIDIGGIGADDRDIETLQGQRQVQRRLSAELHNHAIGLFGVANVQHVFERERLEVEAVAGIVIGGNRLGIAVDHDRFDAHLLQRERRMAAAVVELDSLPYPVGTAAENDHFFARARIGFARALVVRIEIGREAFKLGRAGIHAAEYGASRPALCGASARRFHRNPKLLASCTSEMP